MTLVAGLGGARWNACVALNTSNRVLGVCEQERVTRVRAAGFNPTGLPDEALDGLLSRSGRNRREITEFVVAEDLAPASTHALTRIDHHFAHACAAFLPSPFPAATILICDEDAPYISVWDGDGSSVARIDWPWRGPGFAEVLSRCAKATGFAGPGFEQRFEALARLNPTRRDDRAHECFSLEPDHLRFEPNWEARIEQRAAGSRVEDKVSVAAGLQSRLADLLTQFLGEVKTRAPARRHLCLGGVLFNNTYFNSQAKLRSGFDEIFIPINPGNAGLAVGNALHFGAEPRQAVSPFLGPSYSAEEIKATLDNCKLNYEWVSDADATAIAVTDLSKGRLVGWFEGAMEWGPRALGARSILASPFNPYVLDNLNRFLKQRDPWRGYAMSSLEEEVRLHFDGPQSSPFMECDYLPRDRERYRHILPRPEGAVRVQTVGADVQPRFRQLLTAFGQRTGAAVLVNTSFNGFREPIVCSPRDAVRVFFGTGIDSLVLDRFIVRK